jgi:hypothetical protein
MPSAATPVQRPWNPYRIGQAHYLPVSEAGAGDAPLGCPASQPTAPMSPDAPHAGQVLPCPRALPSLRPLPCPPVPSPLWAYTQGPWPHGWPCCCLALRWRVLPTQPAPTAPDAGDPHRDQWRTAQQCRCKVLGSAA